MEPTELKYRIAIIGPHATTSSFRSLGFTQVIADNPEDARQHIIRLRNDKRPDNKPAYAIIYVLEELASAITNDDWKKWSLTALPAVTLIPTGLKSSDLATLRMKKIVERAVGSDILN